MRLIPDDPIISCIEQTGYPPWMQDEWEGEEDEEEDDETEDEDERDVL